MKTRQKGWVIVSPDETVVYDFTFHRTRKISIKRYTALFSNDKWSHHYHKGARCVKAEKVIYMLNRNPKDFFSS